MSANASSVGPTRAEPGSADDSSVDGHRVDGRQVDEHQVDDHQVDDHRVDDGARQGGMASRRRRGRALIAGLWLLVAIATVAGLALGPVPIGLAVIGRTLAAWLGLAGPAPAGSEQAFQVAVLESVRAPRVLLALACGAVLGAAGATMQGLFRNPLADPGLLGVSAGAAVAAIAVIVLGRQWFGSAVDSLGPFALPLAAFAGAMLVTALVYRVSRSEGRVVIAVMLLAGVAANALAGALIGYLTFLSDEQQLRLLVFWTLGSVGGANWATLIPATVAMLGALAWLLRLARPLDAMALGEDDATHLGIDVARLKRSAALATAIGVGAAVSVTGTIGFIGLVTPHLVRLAAGPSHRHVLLGSALLGAALLVMADLVARFVVAPAELPLGVVTALIGAPFLLWLLGRRRDALAG